MRQVRRGLPVGALVAGGVLAGSATTAGAAPATDIAVCCAWNGGIKDGLTYSVSAPTPEIEAAMAAAIEEWDAEVPGLKLTLASEESTQVRRANVRGKSRGGGGGGGSKAEVVVKYGKGGGQVQGQALRKFDKSGFIKSTSISVKGSAFGISNPADIVAQITKHEVGHALGAGHGNGDGVLMSPTVSGGSTNITACDVDAVQAAQAWFLFDGAATPHQPPVASVAC